MAIQKHSVTILLNTDKANASGMCPVVIRVTVDRKSAYYFTSHRILPTDWDQDRRQIKARVPHSQLINASVEKLAGDAREFLLTAQLTRSVVSARECIDSLGQDGGRDDLLAYWRKMLTDLAGVQHKNTIHQFESDYNKLKGFRTGLSFGAVTPGLLREFDQYMAVVLGNCQNTRWKTFKNLKKLFNLARKDKKTTLYPFTDYDCPRYVQKLRTNLTLDEVEKIEKLIVSGMLTRPLWIAANYFLLSCYAGFRYQDLRAFDPQQHKDATRLVISTLKTGEIVSIPRHTRLNTVLDRLASRPGLVSNQKVNEYLKVIGTLAGLSKELTVHVGRHSFAVICASLDIPSDVVQKLLGHTNIKTTHIYYKISSNTIDSQMLKWDAHSLHKNEHLH